MVCFAPVAPAKGAETAEQTALAKEILGKYNFDYHAAFAIGNRELHHLIFLLFDREDPAEERKVPPALDRFSLLRGARNGEISARLGLA